VSERHVHFAVCEVAFVVVRVDVAQPVWGAGIGAIRHERVGTGAEDGRRGSADVSGGRAMGSGGVGNRRQGNGSTDGRRGQPRGDVCDRCSYGVLPLLGRPFLDYAPASRSGGPASSLLTPV
jgi:hypothetical protein